MKKIFILIFMIFILFIFSNISEADVNDYTSYAYINVTNGKLLRNYSKAEINEALKKTKDRRFCGWRINTFTKNTQCDFITDTLFSVYNEGTTAVKYTVKVASENTTKTSISSTGSISYSVKGDIKKFKNGLDASLKIEGSYSKTEIIKQSEDLSIDVDPKTICIVYVQGQGLLTNGVARYYDFWCTQEKGGFEFFTITNAYVRIEKIAL